MYSRPPKDAASLSVNTYPERDAPVFESVSLFTLTKVAWATPPTPRALPCCGSELRRGFSLRNAEATPTGPIDLLSGPDHGGPVSILATQRGRTRHEHIRLEEHLKSSTLLLIGSDWIKRGCGAGSPPALNYPAIGSSEIEIMSTQFSWKIKRSIRE